MLGYEEYLTSADSEDEEHFEDVHPSLLACCVLGHYEENTGKEISKNGIVSNLFRQKNEKGKYLHSKWTFSLSI